MVLRKGDRSGDIDIGFMGVAPVLVGIDNGMEWKYACGISGNQVAFITDRDYIHSLRDLKDDDRIAILSPACTQHVLLCRIYSLL